MAIRLPNQVLEILRRRIEGRRSRWDSVHSYLKEWIVFEATRDHRKGRNYKSRQSLTLEEREERDEFIISLAKQGRKREEIAEITGLSQPRISQIVGKFNIKPTDTKAKL